MRSATLYAATITENVGVDTGSTGRSGGGATNFQRALMQWRAS
jgi:hypothetical protein